MVRKEWTWKQQKYEAKQGRQKQSGDGPTKLSTIPRITGTQAPRWSEGMSPKDIFENWMPKYAIFGTFSLLAWKMYFTLHLRYKQHKTSVYKMTWKTKNKTIFTINGPAKIQATGTLPPALQNPISVKIMQLGSSLLCSKIFLLCFLEFLFFSCLLFPKLCSQLL